MLLAITGSGIEAVGIADSNLTPAEKTGLRAIGTFMIIAAAHPRLAEYFTNQKYVRRFLLQYNPAMVLSAKDAEPFLEYRRAMIQSRTESIIKLRDVIRKIVPNSDLHRAFVYAAEEGQSAPEWNLLSPDQQRAAEVLRQLELRRGILLKQEGVLDDYRENYVRHLLPPTSFQRWKTHGFRVLPTGGTFTKPRRIDTLRELEAWAKKEGVDGPVMDPAAVYSVHNMEADRALRVVRLHRELERVGNILDHDPSKPIPDKWRPLSILGMSGKIAPEEVATALENIASPRASSSEIANSLDTIKGYWMRSIMLWPWEHGFNVLRSLPTIVSNPSGFADVWRAVQRRDSGMVESASHGLDLFNRPDYGIRSHDGWQRLLSHVNLPSAGAAIDRKFEMMDRWLWEQVVPSLQYFAYSTRMADWAERTKGRFLPSSAEYKAAARTAAEFGNTVSGRVPQELTNPGLARMMRFAMFSPQWTMTRMALIAHAAGDLSSVIAGEMNIRDAAYLQFKMRQLAWGTAITWLGSKLLSGKDPKFNPNSAKFYMDTDMKNSNGQSIGLDVIGWWETDLQVFNHPFNFMFNRLNPVLKLAGETIQGRDYLGRSMTTGQTIGNIISSFGVRLAAPAAGLGIVAREFRGPPVTGGEALQMASRASGAFNVSTLPRPIDAALGKYAKRLLVKQGIPASSDNIFQLGRLLRQNLLSGKELVDDQVINFLAYYRRAENRAHPIGAAISKGLPGEEFQGLWQESRRVLAEF